MTSFDWFTSVGLMPLGYALVGPIADAVGLHATMFAATVIVAALAAGSLLLRDLRSFEPRAPVGASTHEMGGNPHPSDSCLPHVPIGTRRASYAP